MSVEQFLTTKHRGEIGFLIIPGFLVLFGIAMIYSASGVLAGQRFGDATYFMKRQILSAMIAVPLALLVSRIDYMRWKGWLIPFAGVVILLLVLVLLPGVGREVNGSRRWLGLMGMSFQPSEIAKLFGVFYVAHYLSKKKKNRDRWGEGTLPPLVVSGLCALLILLEPDFGSAAGLLLIVGCLMFVGGVPLRHLMTLAFLGLPLLTAWAMGSSYRRDRLLSFLDPWRDPTGDGFQIIQSYLALGGGGSLGVGLGEGRQKLFYLPEPHTDFIFAVAGEEFGLLGTSVLLGLFFLLFVLGIRLALRCDQPFGRLLAVGLTLLVVLPALLNMGVVTGLLPTKGLPLPFVSYGGSSLLVSLLAVGVLYNISRQPRSGGLSRESRNVAIRVGRRGWKR